ncbi:MAG: CRISPR-associated endonuclease Cas1 [Cyanobacteria bacterium P01_D01_bin.128]
MTDELQCLKLARQLVLCRGKSQRKFLMRGQQGTDGDRSVLEGAIARMQRLLKQVPDAESIASRLGLGGNLAALYVV